MQSIRVVCLVVAGVLLSIPKCLFAAEPVTLENVTAPGPNTPDEPLAEDFSQDAAVRFLDTAALDWTKNRKCFTCHTNFIYLMARPLLSADVTAHQQVRAALEEMVEKRWADKGPRWDAEVVMSASVLAVNDSLTTGRLYPTTRKALDRMWTVQREDGGFKWLDCDWPPMEDDDHYGATIALIGVGSAPDGYAETAAAKAGLDRLRSYLKANPPPTLHHRAMLLWASSCVDDILSAEEKQRTIDNLLSAQKADGGWGLASLGDWKRADGTAQDTKSSDGYGTGLAIYVLRRSGVPSGHPGLQKGVSWLKQNQRASGRWFTRSLHKDSRHFISHAGTAFAVMALASCDAGDK